MGSGILAFSLFLALLLRCLAFQQPNTDGFLISEFFTKMGAKLPLLSLNDSSSSFCSWSGVSCDSTRENVVELRASGLGLSGAIPENTIAKLSKLQVLDLSMNNITELSSDLWGLGSSLKTLNLSINRITGPLPNNVGNFGYMETLDLSHNGFSGEIPADISSMSGLRLLNLSRNAFEGRMSEGIANCKNLVVLDLSNNELGGEFSDAFFSSLKNLSFLDFSGNRIQGRLPDLSGMKSISYLNVSGNLLRGSISDVLLETLEVIDLSNNQFEGLISQVNHGSRLGLSSLYYLDLSGNHLSGTLFSDLGRFSSLKHLNLADNRFSHQNFPNTQNLLNLEYLNLSQTNLTGPIPSEFSEFIRLKIVDLSHNQLTGETPDLISVKLRVLDLSSNNLSGEIPLQLLEMLPIMEAFNFSYNNLTFCADKLPFQKYNSSFIGLQNSCPIAANPNMLACKGSKHRKRKLALAVALSVAFFLLGIGCVFYGCRKSTRAWAVKQLSFKEEQNVSGPYSFQTDSTTWVADVKVATSVPIIMFEKPLLNFTFADLLSATSNFDRGMLLAEGRFGPVYRGFLPSGVQVAMKVLVHGSVVSDQDAAKELERLGRIKHPNLVPLTGYCLAGDQRIAIYEYMENGNLHNLLHDLPLGVQTTEDWSNDTWDDENNGSQNITTEGATTWRFRHTIALGVARSLAFLHHGCFPQIVHRDVKSSSIYLDSALEPRLSDFGLSKVVGINSDDQMSQGTTGYAPPELSEPEMATPKLDVYSFGIVLFELVTGKKPIGDEYPGEKESTLVGWVRAMVKKNHGLMAVDPKIRETGSEKQMEEALRIAYLCTADLPSKRPTMQQIVGLLKDIEPVARDQ
ncbi:putative LRR receptor-like serine/threonine-protein kinase [Apostasia shenzhenica]|uniref:Putative LRR receptor-like serine/threonine-protein kinase n=1 Tax=Apostasia shenzhenica TaxID=1088818 RepID=A0A2I0B7Y8_9ASPA|nr:putative LRR receptor-like serine/threonine-protein kinase [Apostasia shenzhenica]